VISRREEIMARIKSSPVTYAELAKGIPKRRKAPLRALMDALLDEGVIKIAQRHRRPHFVLPDYEPEPAYLLDMIRMRSTVDDGGCLIWGGYIDPIRGPSVRAGEENPTSVRRMGWVASKRGRLGYSDTIVMKCGVDACVEVKHMKKAGRGDSTRNKSLTLLHRKKIAESRRKGGALTPERVREIRENNEVARIAAEKAGVSKGTIVDIRSGRSWKEYGGMSGLFTDLINRRAA